MRRYPPLKRLRALGRHAISRELQQRLSLSLDKRRREAVVASFRRCRYAADVFRFAQVHVFGGPSQREAEIIPFLDFAARRSPRTIVEIGTGEGGTTLLFCGGIPSARLVVGVSLFVTNRVLLSMCCPPSVVLRLVDGDSQAPETHEAVQAALGGHSIDLLFIDGDHRFAGVLQDFRLYRQLVAPGGLIAFHDIVPDRRLRDGGPSEAWSGEVPILWEILRRQYRSWEFVESWRQFGSGIGVLEHDPAVTPQIAPSRTQ